MMATRQPQKDLFAFHVDLDQRVRSHHPLRQVKKLIDFSFVRAEVARAYGRNGNPSLDPVVLVKLMFLLFFDDIPSERELMARLDERLDYLWFLDYGLADRIPHHSVLSKARRRWGQEVFEALFVRTVAQCVAAGLVEGSKIHVDASLVDAHASKDSVVQSSPELIAALKKAYAATESKLDDVSTPDPYEAVHDRMVSTTDPDAAVVRQGGGESRPRYHHHRAVDNAHGGITAVETTPGRIAENKKLLPLVEQHRHNTGKAVATAVADHKYGTAENYVACQQEKITTNLGDARSRQNQARSKGIFPDSAFGYDAASNSYRCPAGQTMQPRRLHGEKRTWEYHLPKTVCAACVLRSQCTRAKVYGRTIHRHKHQELLDQARAQAHSTTGKRDRRRRQHLIEGRRQVGRLDLSWKCVRPLCPTRVEKPEH